jgi:hypothetical protein
MQGDFRSFDRGASSLALGWQIAFGPRVRPGDLEARQCILCQLLRALALRISRAFAATHPRYPALAA